MQPYSAVLMACAQQLAHSFPVSWYTQCPLPDQADSRKAMNLTRATKISPPTIVCQNWARVCKNGLQVALHVTLRVVRGARQLVTSLLRAALGVLGGARQVVASLVRGALSVLAAVESNKIKKYKELGRMRYQNKW